MTGVAIISPPRLVVSPAPPVAQFLRGKSADEVATLLPRLFNICPAAQSIAAHLALDLPLSPEMGRALTREITRDHILKLALDWPRRFGLPARADALRHSATEVLAGLCGAPLDRLSRLADRRGPIGDLMRKIQKLFPFPVGLDGRTHADSAASRWADHPLLRDIQEGYGTGPLWRLSGRLVELDALARGWTPKATQQAKTAHVPAARGLYTLRCEMESGRLTTMVRVTPTDRMLEPEASLTEAVKKVTTTAQGEALIALYDPCCPVSLDWSRRDA